MKFDHEVLIVGGGPAGISAAMTLGRITRSALLVDDNRPRNAPSDHLNNFPSHDGINPRDWLQLARKDLEKYHSIKSINSSVLSVEPAGSGFQAKLSSGETISVKKVILAYGVKDKMLPIPGFAELWGKAIFHCPFCHGYEIRGSKIGFLISSEMAFHPLPMIRGLASELTLFTNGKVKLTDENKNILEKLKVGLNEEKIIRFDHEGETLKGVTLTSGEQIKLPYFFFSPEMPFALKSDLGEKLGCKKSQFGFYEVNEMSETTTPGVFAAGDNMSMGHSVLLACASGVKAGMGTIAQLIATQPSQPG